MGGPGERGDGELSIGGLCALAYTLHVERVERQYAIECQAAMTAASSGATNVPMPDLGAMLSTLDKQLAAEPDLADLATLNLREALGIGR